MAESLNVEGMSGLMVKLNALGKKTGTATLKKALRKAGTPTLRQMRAAAPTGKSAHRTYKKRLVAPGFLKRSIRAITAIDKRKGSVSIVFGVRREAYYGIQFLDANQTPNSPISKRNFGKRRGGARSIKSYTLRETPWFEKIFINDASRLLRDFSSDLRTEIERASRGR